MPIRFSTEAANADYLGTDTDTADTPKGMADAAGAAGTSRDRSNRVPRRQRRPGAGSEAGKTGAGKPGNDIDAPGFIKDKDADKG